MATTATSTTVILKADTKAFVAALKKCQKAIREWESRAKRAGVELPDLRNAVQFGVGYKRRKHKKPVEAK